MLGKVIFGVILVAVGVIGAVWPYRVAKVGEIIDAIGRKPAGPVEPAGWNVTVTRLISVGCVLGGIWLVVVGLGTT